MRRSGPQNVEHLGESASQVVPFALRRGFNITSIEVIRVPEHPLRQYRHNDPSPLPLLRLFETRLESLVQSI